jgi:putative toxin-antitoxin system antitoxin component (TIGR02293 family)
MKRYQKENMTYVITARAKLLEFFQDPEKVDRWLNRPNISFDNKKPIEFFSTVSGCQKIIDFIGQMEHGVMPG